MNTQTRLTKLEKERGKAKMTWREFIELAKANKLPEDVAAAFAEFVAEKLAEKDAEKDAEK